MSSDETEEWVVEDTEDNVVYIFDDEEVDNEEIISQDETQPAEGQVYIVNGDEFTFVTEITECELDESEEEELEIEKEQEEDKVSKSSLQILRKDDVSRVGQHIKRKREVFLFPPGKTSSLQVVRKREVQLFSRDELVQPQFCPEFHSEEVVLADSQEKNKLSRKVKTKRLRGEEKGLALHVIKPKIQPAMPISHSVTIDEESFPSRILVTFTSSPAGGQEPLQPVVRQVGVTGLQGLPLRQVGLQGFLQIKGEPGGLKPGDQISSATDNNSVLKDLNKSKKDAEIQERLSCLPPIQKSPFTKLQLSWDSRFSKTEKCNYPKLKLFPVDKHRWLWQFMKELFNRCDPCLRWEDENLGKFHLEDMGRLGTLWGNYKQLRNIRAQSWRQMRYYFGFYEENRIIKQIPLGGDKYLYEWQNLFYKERFIPYKYKPTKDFSSLEKQIADDLPLTTIMRPTKVTDKLFCEKGCGSQFRRQDAQQRHQSVCTFQS